MMLLTDFKKRQLFIFTEFIQLKTCMFFVFHLLSLNPSEMLHTGPLSAAVLGAFSSF